MVSFDPNVLIKHKLDGSRGSMPDLCWGKNKFRNKIFSNTSLVMLPVAGLKSRKESLSLKCREIKKESDHLAPIASDQGSRGFFVDNYY